ncbi:Receptor protein-tyrosine kinase CEPR1 [Camellia lanceoleosa]|uniref:Receptor protein-tyrosine kinase CEPR1 n=1 Tax=Camellia lanceoleosa TaxID=1840588 RepID=A0ACC0FEC0_9ERIC|nr:Receptor protein-tyrosine kinase CEPR1 [Camellia lanceoleosa]
MLSNNSLSGTLPSKLAWNLSRVEISNNQFFGQIPTGIGSWASLVEFKASNNQFTGPIPVEITALSQLSNLVLDGNSLSDGGGDANVETSLVEASNLVVLMQ